MKIYAKAEKVPEWSDYITAGKLYEVTNDGGYYFECKNNLQGLTPCKWENCYHLYFGNYCGNWIRIEAGTLEELNLKEGDVIQCVKEVDCMWVAPEGYSYTVYNDTVIGIDKEFWHEVKHLFTVVSRAEETKGNSVEEELFAGKFKIGDKIHWKYKGDDWDTENFWHQRVYTVVSASRAEHEDGGYITNLLAGETDYKLAEETQVKEPKFKVGDKVRSVYNSYSFCGTVGIVDSIYNDNLYNIRMPHDNIAYYHYEYELEPVEDTKMEQPKMWKDLTDTEKGALLLAYHEGKPIEWFYDEALMHGSSTDKGSKPSWGDTCIYRIKPSPVIEEKEEELWWDEENTKFYWALGEKKFKLKYCLVDGKLDEDSVKVVKA